MADNPHLEENSEEEAPAWDEERMVEVEEGGGLQGERRMEQEGRGREAPPQENEEDARRARREQIIQEQLRMMMMRREGWAHPILEHELRAMQLRPQPVVERPVEEPRQAEQPNPAMGAGREQALDLLRRRILERMVNRELEREREERPRAENEAARVAVQVELEGLADPRALRLVMDLLHQRMQRVFQPRQMGGQAPAERGQGDGGVRVTEEMIKEAKRMREDDAKDKNTTLYTRSCSICVTENPRHRAVFTRCGHIVCFPCAVDNAKNTAPESRCVFCRRESGFVKLFEEEYGSEKKKDDVIGKALVRSRSSPILSLGRSRETQLASDWA